MNRVIVLVKQVLVEHQKFIFAVHLEIGRDTVGLAIDGGGGQDSRMNVLGEDLAVILDIDVGKAAFIDKL